MLKEKLSQYRGGFLSSLCIHGMLLIFLGMSFETKIAPRQTAKNKVEMIQAVVVDEKAVLSEVNRLTEENNQKKAQEQKRISDLKNELLKTKKEAEDKLAQIKLAKEKEAKQLEALKQEKEKEKKRLAALEEQRRKEQEKIKQEKIKQEKVEQQAKASEAVENEATTETEAEETWLNSEIEKYDALMKQKINQSWVRPPGLPGGLQCELYAKLLPDGSVITPTIKVSSGNPAFDQAAIAALQKASPLPVPTSANLMDEFRQFNFRFSPPEET